MELIIKQLTQGGRSLAGGLIVTLLGAVGLALFLMALILIVLGGGSLI
jgi:hypothetical protein